MQISNMEDDPDYTQISMSQVMADRTSTALLPNPSYSRPLGRIVEEYGCQMHGKVIKTALERLPALPPIISVMLSCTEASPSLLCERGA